MMESLYDFVIEFAKKVNNGHSYENKIHAIMTKNGDRLNPDKKFFKTPLSTIKAYLEMIDGEWYGQSNKNNNHSGFEQYNPSCHSFPVSNPYNYPTMKQLSMSCDNGPCFQPWTQPMNIFNVPTNCGGDYGKRDGPQTDNFKGHPFPKKSEHVDLVELTDESESDSDTDNDYESTN